MPVGVGKYDDACTVARESTKARGAIVIIIDGEHGSGFSVQASPGEVIYLPHVLRDLANQIENADH